MSATEISLVPVDQIDTPLGNHRLRDEDVGELADSIKANGLLQRVRVYRNGSDGRYRLAFGHRRLAAHRKLGSETIPAEVYPAEAWNETKIRQHLTVENIQRENLDPVEEALAVSQLVEQLRHEDGLDPVEAERRAAELIGRQYSWVARRMRLRDLDPKVLDQLRAGGMSLGHAIELAKLADRKDQRDLARCITWGESERHVTRVSDLHQRVTGVMLKLRGVPWRLDVTFAGAPACTECPHNSEQRLALFGDERQGDGAELDPLEGHCTKPSCWRNKRRAAESDVKRAAAKLVDSGAKATEKNAEAVARPYTKLGTIARAARKLAEQGSPAKSKKKTKGKGREPVRRTPSDTKWAHDRKHGEWSRKCDQKVYQAILSHPDLLLWYIAAKLLPSFLDATEGINDPEWRKIQPPWNAGRGKKCDALLAAALAKFPKTPGPGETLTDAEIGAMFRTAAAARTTQRHAYHEMFEALPSIIAQQVIELTGLELPKPPAIPESLLSLKKLAKKTPKKKRRRTVAAGGNGKTRKKA